MEESQPELMVAEVRDMGVIESSAKISARDCGYSASYDGKFVLIFGDTLLTVENESDHRLLCNSWSYTSDFNAGDGIAALQEQFDAVGAPTPLIKLTEEERLFNARQAAENCMEPPCKARWAIWPGAIVVHPTGRPAYVFYHKVKVVPGFLNFDLVGHSIAVWENYSEPTERPRFRISEKYPTLIFPHQENGISDDFGSAALIKGEMLYVYGCEFKRGVIESPCLLARVHIDKVLDRNEWVFFAGGEHWSRELADAVSVFHGSFLASVFYNPYIERYIAVYSQPVSTKVMYRTAVRPEGPWSAAHKLFEAEASTGKLWWIYDALVHPELSQENGRIFYVTYSRSIGPMKSEFRLVAVELEF